MTEFEVGKKYRINTAKMFFKGEVTEIKDGFVYLKTKKGLEGVRIDAIESFGKWNNEN